MTPLVLLPLLVHAPAADTVSGRYVEARTASLQAGACHYGGEAVTGGREALLVWRIESGAWGDVDLAGIEIAALIAGESNLAEPGAARRAQLFVDAGGRFEAAAAARAWIARTRGALLGAIVSASDVAFDLELSEANFRAELPGTFALAGVAEPDAHCCAMPQDVWYAPFDARARTAIGLETRFEARASELGRAWSRYDENGVHVGRFGAAR